MSGNAALNTQANARYVAAVTGFSTLARVLAESQEDLAWVLDTIAHAHAIGPVVDPTNYRHGLQNLRDQEEVLRPLFAAAKELQPILARHTAAARIR